MSKEIRSEFENQPRIISFNNTEGFDRGDFQGQVYIAKEEQIGFNALAVFVDGRHPRKKMGEETTRTYLVMHGDGAFDLDDQRFEVSQGDFIHIPPSHEYAYEGKMVLFEVNISPDNSFTDQKLES